MAKWEIIKRIVESLQAEIYLEIGVAKGATFLRQPMPPLKLRIGVSPDVNQAKLIDFSDTRNCMHAVLSDEFFRLWQAPLRRTGVDVAFIDGNHVWEQVERDVLHTLEHLTNDGAIVLHDGSPLTCMMATPALSHGHFRKEHPGESAWTGDVWKAVVCLRSLSEFKHINVFTLNITTGLTIVTRGERETSLPFSREQIKKFTYNDLDKNREQWLNMKSLEYFEERFPVKQEE